MDTDGIKAAIAALAVLCGVIVGAFSGYQFALATREVPEDVSPAPQKRQDDGSLVLERQPNPSPSPAPHAIPKGAVEERRVTVKVQPVRKPNQDSDTTKTKVSVDPVTVTLSLIREGEGRRVIASSPDGTVVGGMDIPISGSIAKPLPWALGASYDPFKESAGLWVERDYGRIRLGVDLYEHRVNELHSEAAVRLRIGWRF